jgi:predicted branched-subunit amino acid permease
LAVARHWALTDARAVLPGMVPFGVLLGVTVATTGADPLIEVFAGAAIYGGSAQLTAITLLDRGLDLIAVVLTAALVNARLLMYSAAMADRFRAQPRLFRWLAPHFLIDQTYLMALGRPNLQLAGFRRYWAWLGGSVLVVWTASIAAGIMLAPVMPSLPHLTLVGTALFLGLLVPRLTDRPAVVAAVVGGTAAALTSLVLPAGGIITGAVAGVAAAMAVRRHG